MSLPYEERMAQIRDQLRQDPSLPARLPAVEGALVQAALDGSSVYEIASDNQMSEEAVWDVLARSARMAAGQAVEQVETEAGLGSDPSPGEEEV